MIWDITGLFDMFIKEQKNIQSKVISPNKLRDKKLRDVVVFISEIKKHLCSDMEIKQN